MNYISIMTVSLVHTTILLSTKVCAEKEIEILFWLLMINTVAQNIQNFTNSTLSSFYFDTIKDRLYNEAESSESRRMAQTVLYEVTKKKSLSSYY